MSSKELTVVLTCDCGEDEEVVVWIESFDGRPIFDYRMEKIWHTCPKREPRVDLKQMKVESDKYGITPIVFDEQSGLWVSVRDGHRKTWNEWLKRGEITEGWD